MERPTPPFPCPLPRRAPTFTHPLAHARVRPSLALHCRDIRGRLAFKLGSDVVQAGMVGWLQSHADLWPYYRAQGVIPGVGVGGGPKAKKDKKDKKKKRGKGKQQQQQQQASGVAAPAPASAGPVDDDEAVLEAAAVESAGIRALAVRRAEEARAQEAVAAAVRSTASRLGVSEVRSA